MHSRWIQANVQVINAVNLTDNLSIIYVPEYSNEGNVYNHPHIVWPSIVPARSLHEYLSCLIITKFTV